MCQWIIISVVPYRSTYYVIINNRSFDFIEPMNYFKDEELAQEIAEALDDMDSLAFHRRCVSMYPEDFLRRQLAKALAMPSDKIRTTRARLYNSLVSRHDKKSSLHSRS